MRLCASLHWDSRIAWQALTTQTQAGLLGVLHRRNLDTVEEVPMMIGDKVLDDSCQLRFDHFGVHKDNMYGGSQ